VTNPTKTPQIETRDVAGDVLVHDPAHDKVHVLNATAGLVLELCDGAHSPTQIAQSLRELTGAEFAVVNRDVETILREFAALQLLEAP
jgi:hypothetical protein